MFGSVIIPFGCDEKNNSDEIKENIAMPKGRVQETSQSRWRWLKWIKVMNQKCWQWSKIDVHTCGKARPTKVGHHGRLG